MTTRPTSHPRGWRGTAVAVGLLLLPWGSLTAASLTPELTPAPRSSRFT